MWITPTSFSTTRLGPRRRLREFNPCHRPAGPEGGQFTTAKVGVCTPPARTPVRSVRHLITQLLNGRHTHTAPQTLHTALRQLAAMATDAAKKGQAAPVYDLCHVTMGGQNPFCGDVRTPEHPEGIPRIAMPQFKGLPVPGTKADALPRGRRGRVDGAAAFMAHLADLGIPTKEERVPASKLKATQAELVGATVADLMTATDYNPAEKPIFISQDGYIIDGHHRWAAVVGRDAKDGRLGQLTMPVIRIHLPIVDILKIATKWTKQFGIAPGKGLREAWQRWAVWLREANPCHDPKTGRFAAKGQGHCGPVDRAAVLAAVRHSASDAEVRRLVGPGMATQLTALAARLPEAQRSLVQGLQAVGQTLAATTVPYGPQMWDGTGAKLAVGTPKTTARIVEKALVDYFGDIQQVKDTVRGSIAVDRLADVPAAVAAVKQHFTVIREKDRFQQGIATGYRDHLLNVQMPNGMVGEVQIHVKPMLRAKETTGHRLYRQVERLSQLGTRAAAKVTRLLRQQEALYASAWSAALAYTFREGRARRGRGWNTTYAAFV